MAGGANPNGFELREASFENQKFIRGFQVSIFVTRFSVLAPYHSRLKRRSYGRVIATLSLRLPVFSLDPEPISLIRHGHLPLLC